ncbi:hypothetical protein KC19_6G108400, partial [Ceratodon purpureus]
MVTSATCTMPTVSLLVISSFLQICLANIHSNLGVKFSVHSPNYAFFISLFAKLATFSLQLLHSRRIPQLSLV